MKPIPRLLFSWVGRSDLNACEGLPNAGLGPIGQAVTERRFEQVVLLSNYAKKSNVAYAGWIRERTQAEIRIQTTKLASPTNFAAIYQAVIQCIETINDEHKGKVQLTYHLSPGTPAMAAVWIIVAKTRYSAELIESSREQGVRTVAIPFDISAEFIPTLFSGADRRIEQLSTGITPICPAFSHIVHRSPQMGRVINRAQKVAPRSVPVLIEGESGTGKELLARAIHEASPRRNQPFVSVNCGAISKELAESELFGHCKGAFTGAHTDREGYFEAAHKGTLFLDEIGELPLETQVKLLRVLQEGQIVRVGETKHREVHVRVISATNRNLSREVSGGRFREDLFYRLAVAVLHLPALRQRQGDVGLLVDHILEHLNRDSAAEPAWVEKRLTPAARNRLLSYRWPGNVRELINTLMRAMVWSDGPTIEEAEIEEAFLCPPVQGPGHDGILGHPIEEGLDLQELMAEVARYYLSKAMEATHENKSRAAELLGLGSYQRLDNWIKKYGRNSS